MILQHLYGLSDPQAELQIKDRLSFQKFVQLDPGEGVPDETIDLPVPAAGSIASGLLVSLLGLLNHQLEARGYILKTTTIVDATIIESSRQRPDVEAARNGTAPDADASYTRKYGRSYYGYKAHVSSDGEHQLIRSAVLRTAKTQDGHVFSAVVPQESQSVYADKIYDLKSVGAWLAERGMVNGILKKGAHHIKLSAQDHENNRSKSRVRTHIEPMDSCPSQAMAELPTGALFRAGKKPTGTNTQSCRLQPQAPS